MSIILPFPALNAALLGGGVPVIVLFAVGLSIALVPYLLNSFALYRIAGKMNLPHGWLGFVPIASTWLYGKIADNTPIGRKKNTHYRLSLLLLPLAGFIFFGLIAGLLIASVSVRKASVRFALLLLVFLLLLLFLAFLVIVAILEMIALYRIFEVFDRPNATMWMIFAIVSLFFCLGGIVPPILMLIVSSNDPVWFDPDSSFSPAYSPAQPAADPYAAQDPYSGQVPPNADPYSSQNRDQNRN